MAKKKAEKKLKVDLSVVNSKDEGIAGLRVEAWDKDQKYDDLLGVGTTDADGKVTLDFTEGRWREFAPDLPDLYFKVFRGKTPLKTTAVIMNVRKSRKETIRVDMPTPPVPGKDRVRARQVFKVVMDIFPQSDVQGAGREAIDKVTTPLRLARDAASRTAETMDLKPIKSRGLGPLNMVGRDVGDAKGILEAKGISVNVKPYEPTLSMAWTEVKARPSHGKPKQMDLYVKGGVVRHCAVAAGESLTGPQPAAPGGAQSARLDEFQRELQAARQMAREQHGMIKALRQEIETLKASREPGADANAAKRMTQIEKDIAELKASRTKTETPRKKTRKRTSR